MTTRRSRLYPAQAQPPGEATIALPDGEQPQIEEVIGRFLPLYLGAGTAQDLAYYLPAGTEIEPLSQDYKLQEVLSVAAVTEPRGRDRLVAVTARVRDADSNALYTLRWRIALTRRDRFYVTAINPTGRS